MHSFTPRTCLWPLTGALISTFALSIGLTFRSNHHCYAGVCGEWLFPLQARLHVVVWYCWLALSVTVLALRAFHHNITTALQRPISRRKIPFIKKELHVSGALTVLWIAALYAVVTGIWWRRLDTYFEDRGRLQGTTQGNHLLAAIALTGHYGDITMGMALLPVSRHSALASFFKLSMSTTLTFHMLTAYTLFAIVLIHGLLYVAWLATRSSISLSVIQSYPILEPTYEAGEVYPGNTSALGIWRASLIFTGLVAALIMLVILITASPQIRQRYFNLFYFTHLTSILAIIIVCLHASTMFYCTAPGLVMIVLDWGMRLYELRHSLDAEVAHLGRGWYLLSVGLPRHRLKGCSCKSPLAHFYIRHSASSVRELHPFTTITHLATQNVVATPEDTSLPIQFLFRKARRGGRINKSESITTIDTVKQLHPLRRLFTLFTRNSSRREDGATKMQWTEKFANLADTEPTKFADDDTMKVDSSGRVKAQVQTKIRFEGPYFTPALPQNYEVVVCIVAGTGVSGALAIASAFAARWDDTSGSTTGRNSTTGMNGNFDDSTSDEGLNSKIKTESSMSTSPVTQWTSSSPSSSSEHRWQRLSIWWSVREEDYIEFPLELLRIRPGLEIRPFLTGSGRPRMDITSMLQQELQGRDANKTSPGTKSTCWAYISGPNGFISAAETACKQVGIDYYGARWDV